MLNCDVRPVVAPYFGPAPLTVLLVVRDKSVAQSIRSSLELSGRPVRVVTAETGSEALAILARDSVRLVVTIVPVKMGFEFVAITSERYPWLPHVTCCCSQEEELPDLATRLASVLDIYEPGVLIDRLALQIVHKLILNRQSSGFLRAIPLIGTLELLEEDSTTAKVSLRCPASHDQAVLFFRGGEVLDAHSTNCGGASAVREVLQWKAVHISVSSGCGEIEPRIHQSVRSFIDETKSQPAAKESAPVSPVAPPVAAPPKQRTLREILASETTDFDAPAGWDSHEGKGQTSAVRESAVAAAVQTPIEDGFRARLLETVDFDIAGLERLALRTKPDPQPSQVEAPTAQPAPVLPLPAPRSLKSATDLIESGFESFRKKDFAAAIELWTKALALDPDNRTLNYNLKLAQSKCKGTTPARALAHSSRG